MLNNPDTKNPENVLWTTRGREFLFQIVSRRMIDVDICLNIVIVMSRKEFESRYPEKWSEIVITICPDDIYLISSVSWTQPVHNIPACHVCNGPL
jgi:hypothetical protein